MGTSKPYGSPRWPGVNPAIGAALSLNNPTDQKIATAVGAFANSYKNHLTSSPTITGEGIPGTGQGHRTYSRGGAGNVARMRSASSGARLAHFINTAARSGLGEALRQFDLSDLRDKPLSEFLDSVADRLSGDGGILDDNSLNHAMGITLNELATDIKSVGELDALLSGGSVDIESILQVYFANILAINFEQKEYSFVREKIPREDTKEFFDRARSIIRAIVRDELSRERKLASIDWNSIEGRQIADEINQEVLGILIP